MNTKLVIPLLTVVLIILVVISISLNKELILIGISSFERCEQNGGQIWHDRNGCTDEFGDHFIPNNLAQQRCLAQGGEWTWGEVYFCKMPVADEGKECTNSSECEDICKVETVDDEIGICTAFSGGCNIVLADGKASWLCS